MFVNFTNHPSQNWSQEQITAAGAYGEIQDVPFPVVDPNGDENYVETLADEYAAKIAAFKPAAVLCQGEMTLAFAVASMLSADGIAALAACSERVVIEKPRENCSSVKRTEFKFTRFRKYLKPRK